MTSIERALDSWFKEHPDAEKRVDAFIKWVDNNPTLIPAVGEVLGTAATVRLVKRGLRKKGATPLQAEIAGSALCSLALISARLDKLVKQGAKA